MILGPDGQPVKVTVRQVGEKPKMHTCLFCGRRSRLGTHCCNARYREDSKFNAETKHQRLNRLEQEQERGKTRSTGL